MTKPQTPLVPVERHPPPLPARSSPSPLAPSAAVRGLLAAKKPRTVEAYTRDLHVFAGWLASIASNGAVTVNGAAELLLGGGKGRAHALIADYKEWLLSKYAPNTVNRRLSSLRALVKVAYVLDVIDWPELAVENVKVEAYRDTRGPGLDGFVQLLGALAPGAHRDRAILRLLFDLALRREEVVTLDLEHVDFAGARLSILGKMRHERSWVTLPQATADVLGSWVAERGPGPGPLFTNRDTSGKGDGRLSGRSVHRMVEALGAKVGLKVWPHALRHAAITEALEAEGSYVEVQKFSRHADPKTVMIYDDRRTDRGGKIASELAEKVDAALGGLKPTS